MKNRDRRNNRRRANHSYGRGRSLAAFVALLMAAVMMLGTMSAASAASVSSSSSVEMASETTQSTVQAAPEAAEETAAPESGELDAASEDETASTDETAADPAGESGESENSANTDDSGNTQNTTDDSNEQKPDSSENSGTDNTNPDDDASADDNRTSGSGQSTGSGSTRPSRGIANPDYDANSTSETSTSEVSTSEGQIPGEAEISSSSSSAASEIEEADANNAETPATDEEGAEENTADQEDEAEEPTDKEEDKEDKDKDEETLPESYTFSAETTTGVAITVKADAAAFDENATDYSVYVTEVPYGSEPYLKYYRAAQKMVQDADRTVTYARFFDITILNAAGEAVEPLVPLQVEIVYSEPIEMSMAENLQIVHFAKSAPELIEAEINADYVRAGVETVAFEQDSFSVSGTIVTNDDTINDRRSGFPTENGDYVMVVKFGDQYYAMAANPINASSNAEFTQFSNVSGSLVPVEVKDGKVIFPDVVDTLIQDTCVWQYTYGYQTYGTWEGEGNYLVSSYGEPLAGWYQLIDGRNNGRIPNPLFWIEQATQSYHGVPIAPGLYVTRHLSISGETSEGVWSEWEPEGVYNFNNSHGTSYEIVPYYIGEPWPADNNDYGWAQIEFDVDAGTWKISDTMVSSSSAHSPAEFFFAHEFGVEKEPDEEPEDSRDLDDPHILKSISPNNATIEGESGDGTYTLALNINGTADRIYQKEKADVLIILDTSASMSMWQNTGWSDRLENPDRRYDAAVSAIHSAAKSLLELNEIDPDMVRLNVLNFGTEVTRDQNAWTGDLNTFLGYNAIDPDRLNSDSDLPLSPRYALDDATNWEAALKRALEIMGDGRTGTADEPVSKYVIFVTDGNPTVSDTRYPDYQGTARGQFKTNLDYMYGKFGTGAEEIQNIYFSFQQAKDDAKALVDAGIDLYAIGIYGGSGMLTNLLAYANTGDEVGTYPANHYFDATSTEAMNEAFRKIANKIEGNMNFTDVHITDGITNLTSTALDTEPDAFVYYKWLEDGNRNIYDSEHINAAGFVNRYSNTINPETGKYDVVAPISIDDLGYPEYTEEQLNSSHLPTPKFYYHTDDNGTVYYTWLLGTAEDYGTDIWYGPKDDTGEYTLVTEESEALKIYNIYEKMDEDGNRWDLKDNARSFTDTEGHYTMVPVTVKPAYYDEDTRTVKWDMVTKETYKNRLMQDTNDYILGHNWTYAVTFPVWPSQEMYDYVSEWNNYDNTTEDANRVNLDDFASDKATDPEVGKYVEKGEPVDALGYEYTLLTNVENSAKLTYTQMSESTKTEDGVPVSVIDKQEPKTIDYNPVDPIVVKDTQIKVTKYWEDLLDTSKLAYLIEDDPDFEVELILLQASHDQDKGTYGERGADGRISYGPLYDETTGKWPIEYVYPHGGNYSADDDYEGAYKIKLKPIWHYYGETELHGSTYATVAEYYAAKGEAAPAESAEEFDHRHVIVDGFEEGAINISVGLMVSNPEDFGDPSTLGDPEDGYVEYIVTYPVVDPSTGESTGSPLPDGTFATSYGWAYADQATLDSMGMTPEQLWADGYIVSASDKDTGEYVKGFPGNTLNGVNRKGTINADGSVTVHYYLLDEGYHYMLRETNRDYAFTLDAQTYHPFLIDGVLYDVNCDYANNTGFVVSHIKNYDKYGNSDRTFLLGESGLSATNRLRPHITLEKLILDGNNRYYYSKNADGTIKTEEVYAPGHEGDDAYKIIHKIRPGNYSPDTLSRTVEVDGETRTYHYATDTGDQLEQFYMFIELELPAKITNLGRINYAVYPEWWDQLVEEGIWTQEEEDAAINHIPKTQSYPTYTYITDGNDVWDLDDPEAPEKSNSTWYIIYGEIPMTPNERVRLYNIPVGTVVTVMENTEQMMADFGDKYELGFIEADWAERQADGSYGQTNNWFYGSDEMLAELEKSRQEYQGDPTASYPENGWIHRNKGQEYEEEIYDDDGNVIGTQTVKEPAMIIRETIHYWNINYDIDVFNYFRPNVEMKKIDSKWDRKKLEENELELDDETDPAGKGEMIDDSEVPGLAGAKFTLYRVVAGDTPEEIATEMALLSQAERDTLIDPTSGDLTDEQKELIKKINDNLPSGQTLTNPFVIVSTKKHLSNGTYEDIKIENVETDENGKIDFGYLRDGVYYLVETKAPSGYALEDRITKITVGANIGDNDKDDAVTYQMLGKPTQREELAWCRTEYDTNSVEKKIYEIAVTDSHVYELPSTGGPGTYLYTIIGTVLLTMAAWVAMQMFAKRKREAA